MFNADVSGWWQQDTSYDRPGYKFMRKLRSLKQKLSKWNKEVFRDSRVEKKKLEKRIKEIDNLEGAARWNGILQEDRSKAKRDWYELIIRGERATMMEVQIHIG